MTMRALVFAIFCLCATGTSLAGDDAFEVIVNPDNKATSIDREFLRDAYLKKTLEWGDGNGIKPVDLASKFPQRDRFTHDVIGKSPSQLKSYWNQQIFSGKGVPPPEAESTGEVIEFVLANPGAVGYLPANADAGRAKVVKVN
jgi:ABC-type phosphate transport system substrate-binding protein